MKQFEVRMDDLSLARLVERDPPALAKGAIRLAVERFAFTANNMTYAVAGDLLGYWRFFSASEQGWGQIPVWGTARVIESRATGITVGDRLYGYFPPAEQVDLLPGKVDERRLVDTAPHRQALPPLYNQYRRLPAEPDPVADDLMILLAPLHLTSFCLWDVLKCRDWHGAEQLLVSSASSKTALGLAFGLHGDAEAPPVIGLTSRANRTFVEETGLYDRVVTYDEVATLDRARSVVVDMAGNPTLVSALFARLGEDLAYRYNVGATHAPAAETKLPGERTGGTSDREMFFAPRYILERVADWGAAEFDRRSRDFLDGTAAATARFMTVEQRAGLDALDSVYPRFYEGSWPPEQGLVILP